MPVVGFVFGLIVFLSKVNLIRSINAIDSFVNQTLALWTYRSSCSLCQFRVCFLLLRKAVHWIYGTQRSLSTISWVCRRFITFDIWQWKAGRTATVPPLYEKDRTIVWGSMHRIWDNMASQVVRISKGFGEGSANWTILLQSSIIYVSRSAADAPRSAKTYGCSSVQRHCAGDVNTRCPQSSSPKFCAEWKQRL